MVAADKSRSPAVPRSRQPVVRVVANVAVAAALSGVALALAAAVTPRLLGYEALAITSGSMGRAAPVGSLVLARSVPAAEVAPGDVITVRRPGRAVFVHRVVSLDSAAGRTTARTRGDANPTPDPEPYPLPDRTQVVAHTIPLIGYLVMFVGMPLGWLLLIAVPATALAAATVRDLWRPQSTSAPAATAATEEGRAELEAELRVAVAVLEAEVVALKRRLEETEAKLAALAARDRAAAPDPPVPVDSGVARHLLLVPGKHGYELLASEGAPPQPGVQLRKQDGTRFVVVRLGPSPLPGDHRRCAYLDAIRG